MPTAHVFNVGSVYFEKPANSTDETRYFATNTPGIVPPTERLERYTYPGVNGQAIKKLGAGPAGGKVAGWVEGSTLEDLKTGKDAVDALCKAQTPGTLSFYDGAFTYSNGIITAVHWGEFWGYAGRVCLNYDLEWETSG